MRKLFMILSFVALITLAVACGGNGEPGGGDPAGAVERYLTAKVNSDDDTIRALLCSEMEAVLERELRTFESVSGAEIQGMACTADPPAGTIARVACDGQIVALYGTEETVFPLSAYRAVQEDGEWKWCGETQ
jgi:hypothetical protein